ADSGSPTPPSRRYGAVRGDTYESATGVTPASISTRSGFCPAPPPAMTSNGSAPRWRKPIGVGPGTAGARRIYHGHAASIELREWAALKGIDLISFAEYQLGYDPTPYAERQLATLARDTTYPSHLYVPQRYHELDGRGRPIQAQPKQDLLTRMRAWLAD